MGSSEVTVGLGGSLLRDGVSVTMVDWQRINSRLPYLRNEEDKKRRKNMWEAIDINGNGYVSLAEITKGVRDVIDVDDLFDSRPAINRSFHHCRKLSKAGRSKEDDYLEFREFRMFLRTLRKFFEYHQAFLRLDTGADQRISKEEFTSESMRKTIEEWVGPIDDIEAEFDRVDSSGGGQILFSEFVDWALEKNLDLEDDIDEEED